MEATVCRISEEHVKFIERTSRYGHLMLKAVSTKVCQT